MESTNKQTHRKRDRTCGYPRRQSVGGGGIGGRSPKGMDFQV